MRVAAAAAGADRDPPPALSGNPWWSSETSRWTRQPEKVTRGGRRINLTPKEFSLLGTCSATVLLHRRTQRQPFYQLEKTLE